ncbi:MAG: SpoIIE family protein phosphatase [Clostridiales bacterium]|nr:SpoIIE family protein phosphatase [Clostridiales bacterium]
MKKTIAKKLTSRVILIFVFALAILYFGAYHTVSRVIKSESERYSQTVVGIYGDLIAHEADIDNVPIDENFSGTLILYGEYLCEWYRVDYVYVYVPDTENGTARFLDISGTDGKVEGLPLDHMTGKTAEYVLSDTELAIWNGEKMIGTIKNNLFEDSFDTVMAIEDTFGNRFMVGAAISSEDISTSIKVAFFNLALIILLVLAATALLIHLIIKNSVSKPAKKICDGMTDFITDGERSFQKLDDSGNDEFGMIAGAFNRMTDEIDTYLENIQSLNSEREHQKTELDIAAKIQKGFLPPEYYNGGVCEINASMEPAKDVGGDLYDYLELDGDRILTVVADISGKGIAASMFMAVTLVLIRQFAKMGQGPAQILRSLNDVLSERNPKMLFATAFIGIFDNKESTFTYSNAGHNLPYLISNTPHVLDGAENTLLGLFRDEEYIEKTVKLQSGDTLFMYTDGVNEATNVGRAFYGTYGIESALRAAKKEHAPDIPAFVRESLREFAGDAEQADDITMLSLTVKQTHTLSLDANANEFEKIKDVIMSSPLPREFKLNLCVAAEECFINICSYAFEGLGEKENKVRFDFEISDKTVMRFEDGGKPYNPCESVASADDYDIDDMIGGLGKLIAFTIADDVKYEYVNGKNVLTMTKYTEDNSNDCNENK